VLFPILLDEKHLIIVIPKDLVYQSLDIVRTNEYYLIHPEISKNICERISTPCHSPCFSMRLMAIVVIFEDLVHQFVRTI
jgi:hypothetical protein